MVNLTALKALVPLATDAAKAAGVMSEEGRILVRFLRLLGKHDRLMHFAMVNKRRGMGDVASKQRTRAVDAGRQAMALKDVIEGIVSRPVQVEMTPSRSLLLGDDE